MKRRDFVKAMFYATAAAGAGSIFPVRLAHASTGTSSSPIARTLVNVMLLGGADLRHLFVPAPGTPYANKFWEKRQSIYRNNTARNALYLSYEDVWADQYLPTQFQGSTFGIHKSAAWLKQQFDAGRVAIIANVIGSDNRRHDHSQLIMQTGDLNTSQFIYDRDGWGGRLAYQIGAGNVLAISNDVSPFCNGTNPANRLEKVIHARDTRNFSLPGPDTNPASSRSVVARALKSYYGGRGPEIQNDMPANWPFRRFFDHESALRAFGDELDTRLRSTQPIRPYSLQYLYDSRFRNYNLHQTSFGLQCANLYDCMLAPDILQLRVASMEYTGWDTHRREMDSLDWNLADIFGSTGGLSKLTTELQRIPGANENLTYVFTSDFGRQLAANGDYGTDHGRGTYMIVLGHGVNGGLYGEMFPESEIAVNTTTGRSRYDELGSDIEGRTSFERVLGAACDWAQPGSGVQVFPNTARNDLTLYPDGPILEPGVDLRTLFVQGYAFAGKITYSLNSTILNLSQVTVKASSEGVVKSAASDYYGKFWINGLADGSYTITPSKPYWEFQPPSVTCQMNGADQMDIDFVGIPQLHISSIYIWRYVDSTTNEDHINLFINGYQFEGTATQVTVGAIAATVMQGTDGYLFCRIPGTVNSGAITLTTSTGSYTHDKPLEAILTS